MEQKEKTPLQREQERLKNSYRELNRFAVKNSTVMVGSSLMEGYPINEIMMALGIPGIVYNRGIRGYLTTDLMDSMDECVFGLEPSRIFINIGTNDIGMPGDDIGRLIENYRKILLQIRDRLPNCQINILAYYPISTIPMVLPAGSSRKPRTLEAVHCANERVKALAEELGLRFIDVNAAVMDETGYMKLEYAMDTIHMKPAAYYEITKLLKPYLMETV